MTTKQVLIIDDEPGMRVTLAANLELEGYDVVTAESGAAAVELVKERSFHAILTDMRMPGMNGLETFRAIREICPEPPVLLMTGFAMEGMVEEAINSGAYAVLRKPFSIESVSRVLARAIHSQVILIVDDDPNAADTLAAALQVAGHRAEAAYGCDDAARVVRDSAVDLCVVDLLMPDKDGLVTFEEVRAIDGRIILIAVTGQANERLIAAALKKGYYACLRKGFHINELVNTIARARVTAEFS